MSASWSCSWWHRWLKGRVRLKLRVRVRLIFKETSPVVGFELLGLGLFNFLGHECWFRVKGRIGMIRIDCDVGVPPFIAHLGFGVPRHNQSYADTPDCTCTDSIWLIGYKLLLGAFYRAMRL